MAKLQNVRWEHVRGFLGTVPGSVQPRTCECRGIGVMGDTLCSGCQERLGRAAKALGKMVGDVRTEFVVLGDDRWAINVGGRSWEDRSPLSAFKRAVMDAQEQCASFALSVAKSAAVGRTNSTAQREFDRIQDIVSKAIEILGVELKYA